MSELIVSADGAVATVTMSHPGKRNAITAGMWREFPGVMAGLEADRSVRVVVVTGAHGDFSAGSDITGLLDPDDSALACEGETGLRHVSKPVIAAIQGYCLGAGAQVALGADLRIAADDARFGVPPANLGIIFPLAGIGALVDAVGQAWAKRLVFTGERVDAATALRIGLVDELCPSDDVLPRARELAARIASRSQLSVRAAKSMMRHLSDPDGGAAVAARWQAEGAVAGDLAEGQAAFLARREPRFTWEGPVSPAATR